MKNILTYESARYVVEALPNGYVRVDDRRTGLTALHYADGRERGTCFRGSAALVRRFATDRNA